MGRWVTSKGRRIYIPDPGEENPFVKNKGDKVRLRGTSDSIRMMEKYGIKSKYDKDKNEYEISQQDYDNMLADSKNKKYVERLQVGKGNEIQAHGYLDKTTTDNKEQIEREMWNLDDMISPGSIGNKFTDEQRTERINKFLDDYSKNPDKYKGHEGTVKAVKKWASEHNTNGKRFNKVVADNEALKEKQLAQNKKQAERVAFKSKDAAGRMMEMDVVLSHAKKGDTVEINGRNYTKVGGDSAGSTWKGDNGVQYSDGQLIDMEARKKGRRKK